MPKAMPAPVVAYAGVVDDHQFEVLVVSAHLLRAHEVSHVVGHEYRNRVVRSERGELLNHGVELCRDVVQLDLNVNVDLGGQHLFRDGFTHDALEFSLERFYVLPVSVSALPRICVPRNFQGTRCIGKWRNTSRSLPRNGLSPVAKPFDSVRITVGR